MTGSGAVFAWLATIWAGLALPAPGSLPHARDPLERTGGRSTDYPWRRRVLLPAPL